MKLLKSSLWDAGICPEEAIKDAESSSSTSSLAMALGLTAFRYPKYDNNYSPYYKRRRGAPTRHRQYQQSYQNQPSTYRNHQNYQQNQTHNQRFRNVSRGARYSSTQPTRGNWRPNNPKKSYVAQEQKSQQNQRENTNNFQRNKNTGQNKRGNRRK